MKDYLTIVESVLAEHPDARDDDFRLYGWVCKRMCPDVMDLSFKEVLWKSTKLGLPSYETVTRARRKAQETNPALRGKKYKKRQERQADYIEQFGGLI